MAWIEKLFAGFSPVCDGEEPAESDGGPFFGPYETHGNEPGRDPV